MTTRDLLTRAFVLATSTTGKLALMLASGRGLRRSEIEEMQRELESAARTLGRIEGE